MSQPRSAPRVASGPHAQDDPIEVFRDALSPTARQILDVSATQLAEARQAIADGDVGVALALYASVIPIHWGPLHDLRAALVSGNDVAALNAMGDVAALICDLMMLAAVPWCHADA